MSSEAHKKAMRKYMNKKYHTDPNFRINLIVKMREVCNRQRIKKRDEVFNLFGGYRCSCKGINCWHEGECIVIDKRVMQLDHINGKGTLKNKKLKIHGSSSYQYYLKDIEKTKREIQPLCANCNWVKRTNNKEIVGRPRKH